MKLFLKIISLVKKNIKDYFKKYADNIICQLNHFNAINVKKINTNKKRVSLKILYLI